MKLDSKILIAGSNGLVGSAIVRKLEENGYTNIIKGTRNTVDFTNQKETEDFFQLAKPEYVFLSAAKVGGIGFNKDFPAEFIYENLMIQTNIIHSSYLHNAKKLLFLGSACIYPKHAPVPIKEEYLMTDLLEPTNIAYSIAKISGYMMCKKYTEQYGMSTISVMPNNLYGIYDNFNLNQCHVIPSFINKFVRAKDENLPEVVCFGDGSPTREFLFSDDLADGLIFLMNNYDDPEIINIGPQREVSIKELSELLAKIIGYDGKIVWDITKPNGTPRRALDTSKMDSLGWKAKTSLEDGLKITIDWFLENRSNYGRV
ncbi:MAG: GDP-L-fucose synthase family protein [Candidatus Nanopelagicaceae bacterium]